MPLDEARGTALSQSTALSAAALRAAGVGARDPAFRCPDHLAPEFVPWGPRLIAIVKLPALRPVLRRLAERIVPGSFFNEIARTKFIDDVVRQEVVDGADQVVMLGAGFDTRVHRIPELGAAIVFEVDHPVTQALKRKRAEAVVGPSASNLHYVSVDFEHQVLGERLAGAGYSAAGRTVFVWSGVSMYISAEAVAGVLEFVAGAGPGSAIVFDYTFAEAMEHPERYYGAAECMRVVSRQGEPFQFGVPEGGIGALLERHGLKLATEGDADELSRRYLTDARGRMHRPYGFGGICVAKVPG
jgi:methyltransferase (TIGR00027 family)